MPCGGSPLLSFLFIKFKGLRLAIIAPVLLINDLVLTIMLLAAKGLSFGVPARKIDFEEKSLTKYAAPRIKKSLRNLLFNILFIVLLC